LALDIAPATEFRYRCFDGAGWNKRKIANQHRQTKGDHP
jgi:hypothetical protein